MLLFALSLSTLLCGAQTQNADLLPEIRDTFFGLRLGAIQSRKSIQKAVGEKGEQVWANEGTCVVFYNIPFEGKTWDIVLSYTISRDASELAHGKVDLSYFRVDHFERPRRMVYRGIREELNKNTNTKKITE